MTTNRVLVYLNHDRETAGYVRAKRCRRRALDFLDRLPDVPEIELTVSSVESFVDGGGRVSWFFTSHERDNALPVADGTELADVAAAMRASIRAHVDALLAAAAALERVES